MSYQPAETSTIMKILNSEGGGSMSTISQDITVRFRSLIKDKKFRAAEEQNRVAAWKFYRRYKPYWLSSRYKSKQQLMELITDLELAPTYTEAKAVVEVLLNNTFPVSYTHHFGLTAETNSDGDIRFKIVHRRTVRHGE